MQPGRLLIDIIARDPAWGAATTAWVRAAGHRVRTADDPPADVVLADAPTETTAEVVIIGRGAATRLLRRLERLTQSGAARVIGLAAGRLDLETGIFTRGPHTARLTGTELRLVRALLGRAGEAVPRAVLLADVWGLAGGSRVIEATMARLRAKIEVTPRTPAALLTVRGVGYRVRIDPQRAAGPTNLTPLPHPLIGREAEQAAVSAALRDDRLVALSGAPGIGKTHLARAVGERARHDLAPDGVWYCDLQGVTDRAGLRDRVSAVLGVHTRATLDEALVARGATLLICDHLGEVAGLNAQLDAWLGQTQRLRVLLVARAPVGTDAHAIRLGPLAPEDAAQLFAARAGGDFALDTARRPAVARIVAALHANPMSVCLAAGRAAMLDVEAVAADLDARLDGLTRPDERMRAALELTWAALAPDLRDLASACATFAGSFDADAVEALVAGPALDDLQALTERAIIERTRTAGRRRLHMAAPIRAFVLTRTPRAARPLLEARAAQHFAQAAARMADAPLGMARATALQRLMPDVANLAAARRLATDPACAYATAAIARRTGPLSAGLETVLTALDTTTDPVWRARLVHLAADIAWAQGDPQRAQTVRQQAHAHARALEGAPAAVATLAGAVLADDFETARRETDAARAALGAGLGDAEGAHVMARVAFGLGHLATAHRFMLQAITAFQQPNTRRTSHALGSIGLTLAALARWPGAPDEEAVLTQILGQVRAAGDRAAEAELLAFLAYFALQDGRIDVARRRLEASLTGQQTTGYHALRPPTLTWLGLCRWAAGDLPAAATTFDAALTASHRPALRGLVLAMAAPVAERLGHADAGALAERAETACVDAIVVRARPLFLACRPSTPRAVATRRLAEAEAAPHPELSVVWARRMLARRLEST